jgi:hypothetical protein
MCVTAGNADITAQRAVDARVDAADAVQYTASACVNAAHAIVVTARCSASMRTAADDLCTFSVCAVAAA